MCDVSMEKMRNKRKTNKSCAWKFAFSTRPGRLDTLRALDNLEPWCLLLDNLDTSLTSRLRTADCSCSPHLEHGHASVDVSVYHTSGPDTAGSFMTEGGNTTNHAHRIICRSVDDHSSCQGWGCLSWWHIFHCDHCERPAVARIPPPLPREKTTALLFYTGCIPVPAAPSHFFPSPAIIWYLTCMP